MDEARYPRIAALKTPEALAGHLRSLGVHLPLEPAVERAPESPLAQPLVWKGHAIGNRWCILPMEGWDGTEDGRPSELTIRRWVRFGESGAKLIWGGEAVAVTHDGRANPNQLAIRADSARDFASLREALAGAHRRRFGRDDDLLVGLQLTHSGRFCRPNRKDRLEPRILYHHPILDRRFGIAPDHPVLSDGEVRGIVDAFVAAARLAAQCGYAFVDVKHCHGYLGHEFLSAVDRPGRYGGSFANRTRFLREVVDGIRAEAPGLGIVVRFTAFDLIPFTKGEDGRGAAERSAGPYRHAFGCDPEEPTRVDLGPAQELLRLLAAFDIDLVCATAGSPYYNPHVQRPALFPPSDGYTPPEDPLVGVARQIEAAAELKRQFPDMRFVGSAYSYLQEFLPHVGQGAVRQGWTDFVGLGRMALTYPDIAADVLEGRPLSTARICRTFSDCTTAPRGGLISGCFPLDPFYRERPEAAALRDLKDRARNRA